MGFLTRCKRPFLFAFLLQFCNMLFSFFLKTFLILFEKQHQLLIIQAIAEDAKLKADDAALAKYFSDNMGTEDYSTYEEHFGRPYVSMVVLSELANNYLMDNAVNA